MYHCVGNAGRHRTQAWRTTSDIRPHGNSEHTTPPRRRNQHNDAKCWPNGKDERARTIAVMKVTHRRLRCHQHVIALGGAPSPHKRVLSLHMHMPTHLGRTLDLCCGRSCWLRSTQLPHQTFRHLWRPHMKVRRSRTRKTRPRRRGSGSCVDCHNENRGNHDHNGQTIQNESDVFKLVVRSRCRRCAQKLSMRPTTINVQLEPSPHGSCCTRVKSSDRCIRLWPCGQTMLTC